MALTSLSVRDSRLKSFRPAKASIFIRAILVFSDLLLSEQNPFFVHQEATEQKKERLFATNRRKLALIHIVDFA